MAEIASHPHRLARWLPLLALCTALSALQALPRGAELVGQQNGVGIIRIKVPGSPPPAGYVSRQPARFGAGDVVLSNVPIYDWCYGCTATSAGMMMGYYDRSGLSNLYAGPANGGVCPLNNETAWATGEAPFVATHIGIDGRSNSGHVEDYWGEPDPCGSTPTHSDDCLADFMGTSQNRYGTTEDGSTWVYTYNDGSPLNNYDAGPTSRDAAHGMGLYATWRGYNFTANFNQLIVEQGQTYGFSFDDYCTEIDAGRPVMIQVSGHSMLGVGYNRVGNVVWLCNTWGHTLDTMTWGGSYEGMGHYAVTVFRFDAQPRLAFVQQPADATSGQAISPAVTVEVLLANGTRDTSFTGPVTIGWGSNPSGASLGGTKVRNAVAGLATFSNLIVTGTGTGFTLEATAADHAPATSETFNAMAPAVPAPFDDDFSADRGWTGLAADGWERGPAVASTYDPANDTTPSSDGWLLGYNIGGDYAADIAERAVVSPPIDCSGLSDVVLTYRRALTIEESSYDHAAVRVSNNGTTWTTIWSHAGDTVTTPTWSGAQFDISAVAAGQPRVFICFVMGDADSSVQYGGWSIDDVHVGSANAIVATPVELSVPEGGNNRFSVRLLRQPAAETTVTVARSAGDSNISVTSGATYVFTTANWSVPQNVTLSAAQDADITDGTAVFRATSPGWAAAEVTATEADDDRAVIASPTALTIPESESRTFGVRLGGQPAADVTVTTARAGGDSGHTVAAGASLTFTPANWNTPQLVSIAAAGDVDVVDGTALFRCTAPGWARAEVTTTETDNDERIVVAPPAFSVPESGTATYTVRLGGQPAADVLVSTARSAGDSSMSVTGGAALTFTPANWNLPQNVTVAAASDIDVVNGRAVLRSTAPGWTAGEATATEVDDDLRILATPTSLTVPEFGTQAFGVRLAGQPSANVTVSTTRSAGDSSLSVDTGATLTFTPANWHVLQWVTLFAAQDTDAIHGRALFRSASSGWAAAEVAATELDNDLNLVVTPSALTVPEGTTRTFTVRLGGLPAADVTVTTRRISGDTNLAIIGGATLLFTPANWSVPQVVTVRATADLDAVAGSALFRANAAGWCSASVTATEQEPASAGPETLARPDDS